ncbi:MAG: type II toxin-antitoxin system RelE/ParE family toxin [Bauldia sp.]|nr:type II toxin-antitoxin system RelE/ParE family toxin [Bauldia sp.]
MTVEFTRQAVADLERIGNDSRLKFGQVVAARLRDRIADVIARAERSPSSAPAAKGRPGVRVAPIGRYPFRLYYLILPDRIVVQHIRHTSRRPW